MSSEFFNYLSNSDQGRNKRRWPELSTQLEGYLLRLEAILDRSRDTNTSWKEKTTVMDYTGSWKSQRFHEVEITKDLTLEEKEQLRLKTACKIYMVLYGTSAQKIAEKMISLNPPIRPLRRNR